MRDKRKYKRVDKQFLASYEILNNELEITNSGMAVELDLSMNGIQLELPVKPEIGTSIRVRLALVDRIIAVFGHVVWLEQGVDVYHVGLKLTKIQKGYREIIKDFLSTEEK
ncbi:MAG: hypothetical protein CSA81_07810 [Acidobacteria bacterium]|nr:MAG: hypothetical protein CSA81_07810 [Acidobacteriota bacterium]